MGIQKLLFVKNIINFKEIPLLTKNRGTELIDVTWRSVFVTTVVVKKQ